MTGNLCANLRARSGLAVLNNLTQIGKITFHVDTVESPLLGKAIVGTIIAILTTFALSFTARIALQMPARTIQRCESLVRIAKALVYVTRPGD